MTKNDDTANFFLPPLPPGWCTNRKIGVKWRKNAPHFRILTVFTVPISPIFRREIGTSRDSRIENVMLKYPKWANRERARYPSPPPQKLGTWGLGAQTPSLLPINFLPLLCPQEGVALSVPPNPAAGAKAKGDTRIIGA